MKPIDGPKSTFQWNRQNRKMMMMIAGKKEEIDMISVDIAAK